MTLGLEVSQSLPGLGLKPFSTARQALAPVEALIDLLDAGLDPASIRAIVVRAPSAFAGMISQPVDVSSRASGYVNAPFQMAFAALRRRALWDLDRAEAMADADVQGFARRVTVEKDLAFDEAYPLRWSAQIEVRTDQERLTQRIDIVHGDADRPLSDADLQAKALMLLAPGLGEAAASDLWRTASSALDDAAALARLVALLKTSLSSSRKQPNGASPPGQSKERAA
jgi:2-methylcitrate dehydratase PrpD